MLSSTVATMNSQDSESTDIWGRFGIQRITDVISEPFTVSRLHGGQDRAVCVRGRRDTYVVLPSVGLQHRRQEAVGEGETGEPEQGGGRDGLRPANELTDPLAQIPGPGGQGLQRGVRLVGGGRHSRWGVKPSAGGRQRGGASSRHQEQLLVWTEPPGRSHQHGTCVCVSPSPTVAALGHRRCR